MAERVEGTVKWFNSTKGFGLGLSYVKSIVQLHHGTVKLTSKKGEGTQVQIILMKEI